MTEIIASGCSPSLRGTRDGRDAKGLPPDRARPEPRWRLVFGRRSWVGAQGALVCSDVPVAHGRWSGRGPGGTGSCRGCTDTLTNRTASCGPSVTLVAEAPLLIVGSCVPRMWR